MISLVHVLKSLSTTPRPTNRRGRNFVDSSALAPKASLEMGCTTILTANNEADSTYDRVSTVFGKHSRVIVIDQGSIDGTPYFAAESGTVISLQELNMTYEKVMYEVSRLARRTAASAVTID
jgi:hypothetical protein